MSSPLHRFHISILISLDNFIGENRTILGNLQFGNSELVVANAETMTP